jgi:hypothetical protein
VTIDGVWIGNWIYWPLTDRNYVTIALSLIHTLYSSLQHVLLSLLCLHQSLPGNSFQRWTFPLLWVPELSLCLSYQHLTVRAHNNWTSFLWLLTNSATNSSIPCTALTNWTVQCSAVAYCRQPASTVTLGIEPHWDPWPYICSVSRLVFSPFVVPPLIKREGLGFFIIGAPLLHLTPPEVTLK